MISVTFAASIHTKQVDLESDACREVRWEDIEMAECVSAGDEGVVSELEVRSTPEGVCSPRCLEESCKDDSPAVS